MGVAAFFRDVRVNDVLINSPPASAAGILGDFFARFDYGDCASSELLALADLAVRGGQPDVARTSLEHVLRSGELLHLAHYKLGRLDLAAEEYQSACSHFRAGTVDDPSFAYNWMGAARTHYLLGDLVQAAEDGIVFSTFGLRPHAKEELSVLATLADFLFESGDRRRSLGLFRIVAKFGNPTPRGTLRLAEALIASQDYPGALAVLRLLQQDTGLDAWGLRALALCLSHCGEPAEAIEMAEAALLQQPANAGFIATYLDSLVRSNDAARMQDGLARNGARLGPAGITEIQLRLHLLDDEVAEAAEKLAEADIVPNSRMFYACLETGYAALRNNLPHLAQDIVARLREIAPEDAAVRLLGVDFCFREQRWEDAASLLDRLPPETGEQPRVLLKRFELACFQGNLDAARDLWKQIEAPGPPPKPFMLARFRFLAELKQWDALVDEALAWIDTEFRYDQIGYVLFRAAKHSGRGHEIIAAIEGIDGWALRGSLVQLRASLLLDAADTLERIETLLADTSVDETDSFVEKAKLQRGMLLRAGRHGGRQALCFCTDRNYLCATIVALDGAVRRIDKQRTDIFLVVDAELAEAAGGFVRSYLNAGYRITIVPSSEVVGAAEPLRPAYGLFTSGHSLAAAAYYRIYLARYLQRMGAYDRAIYIDSDVLLRRPLHDLYDLELDGYPLAARVEAMRPDVRRAIDLHRITDGRYFNSGVLVFDLRNDQLGHGLESAIGAIGDPGATLLYHDQCALNLGFRNRFLALDRKWNFPVGEATLVSEIPGDTAILHFLDRPKPWSAAYAGQCGRLWCEAWAEVAAFIGDATAIELFRLSEDKKLLF